jgi:hypothetical protein
MISQNSQSTPPANGASLADLGAEIERLRRDLNGLGSTLRAMSAREWDAAGARLGAAVAENRKRILNKISAQPEKAAATAAVACDGHVV